MKNKTKLALVLALILATVSVFALDASTPYTVSLKWIVPTDTTFTVAFSAGGCTSIDFHPATKTVSNQEPWCQNASQSTPVLTATNAGNVALNFTHYMQSANPAWAVLYASNTSSEADAKTVVAEPNAVVMETGTPIAGTFQLFIWTNVTDATGGTTTRTYQLNSSEGY